MGEVAEGEGATGMEGSVERNETNPISKSCLQEEQGRFCLCGASLSSMCGL